MQNVSEVGITGYYLIGFPSREINLSQPQNRYNKYPKPDLPSRSILLAKIEN